MGKKNIFIAQSSRVEQHIITIGFFSGDHYLPLSEVLRTETTDTHRPAAQESHKHKKANSTSAVDYFMSEAVENQQKEPGLFTAQHARAVVSCQECSKQE